MLKDIINFCFKCIATLAFILIIYFVSKANGYTVDLPTLLSSTFFFIIGIKMWAPKCKCDERKIY